MPSTPPVYVPRRHPARLEGSLLKLWRARELIAELRRAVTAYEALTPWAKEEALDGSDIVVSSRITVPPPPEIGLILGDVVQNLRAALDYLVYELTDSHSQDDQDALGKCQFLIETTTTNFNRNVSRYLGAVSTAALDFVRWHQPYAEGLRAGAAGVEIDDARLAEEVAWHPLTWLRDLSNHDKHRRLLVLAAAHAVRGVGTDGAPSLRFVLRDGQVVILVSPEDRPKVHPMFSLDLWCRDALPLESLIEVVHGHEQVDELADGLARRVEYILAGAMQTLRSELGRRPPRRTRRPNRASRFSM